MSDITIGTVLRHKEDHAMRFMVCDIQPFATPRQYQVFGLQGYSPPKWLTQAEVDAYFEIVPSENDDLAAARATQVLLRDELTAITEERDKLETACKAFEANEAWLIETMKQVQAERDAARAEVARLQTTLHFMIGFLHEDVENIETAQKIIALARKTVKDAITTK